MRGPPETRRPAALAALPGRIVADVDLGRIAREATTALPQAQQNLVAKIAASAGQSLAVATVLVLIALGDARPG